MPVANVGEARDIVYGQLESKWAAGAHSSMPIYYDSEAADAPDTGYLEVSIRGGTREQATVGARNGARYRQEATMIVDIYVPTGTGSTVLDESAEIVQAAFENVAVPPDTVQFLYAQWAPMPRNGGFDKVRVAVSFNYDQLR